MENKELKFSDEMRCAWEFVEHTGASVFLTGKAGTGKTTFLRYVAAHTAKTYVITAPTGVAAINAGGVTLHSFFQLPIAPYVPGSNFKTNFRFSKQKLRIIRALDLLIIDEISMVRSDLLDSVDATLRRLRGSVEPFGGVQLLMIGDLQQLAPVVTPSDQQVLTGHYATPYFFGSQALARTDYVTIGLKQVFRQQDPEFLQLLNHIRSNMLTAGDMARLDALCKPDFQPQESQGYIRLTTHNRQADYYNNAKLSGLPGRSRTYDATIQGDFPESSFPTDARLCLKVGAQVMFIKNDSGADARFYNGKIGRVERLDDHSVSVRCQDDGIVVDVQPMEWENARYEVDEQTNTVTAKIDGIFSQIPLRLAWAITIHKSQGLTFNRAVIDAGQAFAPGQVYVALSRCRSLDGVVLATPLGRAHTLSDPKVTDYISGKMRQSVQASAAIDNIRNSYRRALLAELFSFKTVGEKLYKLRLFAGERLGRGGAAIASVMAETETTMQKSLTEVAIKWNFTLGGISDESLDSEAVRARIENGIAYFLKHLEEDVAKPLELLNQVRPGNKLHAAGWKELYVEFDAACKIKKYILEKMGGQPFSTDAYLNARREALLESTREKKSSRKSRSGKK